MATQALLNGPTSSRIRLRFIHAPPPPPTPTPTPQPPPKCSPFPGRRRRRQCLISGDGRSHRRPVRFLGRSAISAREDGPTERPSLCPSSTVDAAVTTTGASKVVRSPYKRFPFRNDGQKTAGQRRVSCLAARTPARSSASVGAATVGGNNCSAIIVTARPATTITTTVGIYSIDNDDEAQTDFCCRQLAPMFRR